MKHLLRTTAAIVLAAFLPLASTSAEDAPVPIVSATVKSYKDLHEMVGTLVKTVSPEEANPMLAIDLMVGETINREKPMHLAVWPNGILQPLVAAYVPTDNFAGLKKKLLATPMADDTSIEEIEGYLVLINGAKASLEENLEAARSTDPAEFAAEMPIEIELQLDDSTRKMLKGIMAAGRLGLMQQGEDFGGGAEAELMMEVFDLYFDMLDGFVDGMNQTKVGFGIVDEGLRTSLSVTARDGSTFGKLIAKESMDPAPLAKNYFADKMFAMSLRMASYDESMEDVMSKMMSLSLSMTTEDESTDEFIEMMRKMVPFYGSIAYDFDEELAAYGIYQFPKGDGAADLYPDMIKLSANMGKQMAEEGSIYSGFEHKKVTKDGVEVDRFTYKMGDALPSLPIFGDKMEIEYALKGKDMVFGMGKDGVSPLLKDSEAPSLPKFLVPDETTVMIGHFDILALVEKFKRIEISLPEQRVFIDAKDDEKNTAGDASWNKVQMRASIEEAFHFDFHVPLTTIKVLSKMR